MSQGLLRELIILTLMIASLLGALACFHRSLFEVGYLLKLLWITYGAVLTLIAWRCILLLTT